MEHSKIEKMIETVLEPRNHIDGLRGDSKSPHTFAEFSGKIPVRAQFLRKFFKKIKKKKVER
jgi:hypothetical protein